MSTVNRVKAATADDIASAIEDSAVIAQAGINLIANRCVELGLVPLICFMLMIRLCEKNIEALSDQEVLSMPLEMKKAFEKLKPALSKHLNVKIETETDLVQHLVDEYLKNTTFHKEYLT